MKAFVFLLVLVNLIFYAYSAGHLGQPSHPDAGRINNQVAPERIRVVSRGEAPAPKPAEAAAPTAPAPEAAAPLCLRWEQLGSHDADRLEALLREEFTEFRTQRQNVASDGQGWWVFIAPLASKAEADKKAGELRQLGVSDYFIIPDGPQRHAISLGVFSTEKGGNGRLAELKAKGVRTARLAPRPGKETLAHLEARGPASDKEKLLARTGELLPRRDARTCP